MPGHEDVSKGLLYECSFVHP